MEEKLTSIELRILGALIEKQMSTPAYYPMTINALVNACNQKSNREPVVEYDEMVIETGLGALRQKELARKIFDDTGRVPKHCHLFSTRYELSRAQTAVLCELMLRGPQTTGELRAHTRRLHGFNTLGEVEATLDALMGRDAPLVAKLPRRTGLKEQRYAHLLGDEPLPTEDDSESAADEVRVSHHADAIRRLEVEIAGLRRELNELRESFATFRKQFE